MKNCERCNNFQKKYKILEAQMTFQVKILQEDMAQQKLTLDMVHQKEIKKLAEKLQHDKQEREAENKKWIQKYDSMIRNFDQRLAEKEEQFKDRMRKNQHQLTKKLEHQKQEKELKIRGQLEQLRTQSDGYKKKLLNVKEQQKKLMSKFHQDEIAILLEKFKKDKQLMEEEKNNLKNEIKQLQKNQLTNKTIQIQLAEEIFFKKQDVDNLKQKIAQLQHTVKLCYDQIGTKENIIGLIRKEYSEKIKKLQKEFNTQKEQLLKKHAKNLEVLLQKQIKNCQNYQKKLKEIEQKRQNEIKLYHSNFSQMKTALDQNRCPPKVTEEINHLKVKLYSKDKEIQKAKQQIKHYQLQMENNDEILTKFFLHPSLAATSEDLKSTKHKEFKIKKNRSSMTGTSFIRDPSKDKDKNGNKDAHFQILSNLNVTSMQSIENIKSNYCTAKVL